MLSLLALGSPASSRSLGLGPPVVWPPGGEGTGADPTGVQPTPPRPATSPPVPCAGLDIPLNRWVELEGPGEVSLRSVGSFAQSPCTFVGSGSDARVYLSSDAGSSWRAVLDLGEEEEVNGVVTEEVPAGTAFVLASPGPGEEATGGSGLYVTRDFGASFEEVDDFAGLAVTALAVAPGDPQRMYAAAGPELPLAVARGLLFRSDDFGNSWTPLPGGLPMAPSRLAVDPFDPDIVWANSDRAVRPGAPPGLWLSDDAGVSWRITSQSSVTDLDTAAIAGSSRLDAATPTGILRTRDLGSSFSSEVQGRPVTSIDHEPYLAQVIVAVIDNRAQRSIDEGSSFAPTAGSPDLTGCSTRLTRDEELTAHFFLSAWGCDGAGQWLFRSDGLDVLGEGYFDSPDPGLPAGRRPRVEMEVLREVRIPRPVGRTSGSVAFDGRLLYYTANSSLDHIYVMTADGYDAGEIVLPSNIQVNSLTYDSTHDSLWVVSPSVGSFSRSASVYEVQLDTGSVEFRFTSPVPADTSLSWDPSLGHFRTYEHHGYEVYEVGLDGRILDRCEVAGFPVDPNISLNPDRGHPESSAPGFASGLAAGNGNIYLNLEDDRTIYYVGRDCEILVVLEHRRFAESTSSGAGGGVRYENDQLACDTTTFGRAALWIRDADSATMVAYAIPDGYCPLDTQLEVVPQQTVATEGRQSFLCARLRISDTFGSDGLIAGQEIRFFIDGTPITSATTDHFGLACTTQVFPRGGADHLVQALFFGNSAYRSARAEGAVRVLALPRPPARIPPPNVPPPLPPFTLQVAPQAPPPNRPEIPAPQSQPQPQQQLQGNAAMALQEQQQPQLAFVNASREFQRALAEEYAMTSQKEDESQSFRMMMLVASLMAIAFASLSIARARVGTAWQRR